MLCVLGLAAVIFAFLRGRGGPGTFTWPDRPNGPNGPTAGSSPGPHSSSIVATRCYTGASEKCDTCVVHKSLGGSKRLALSPGN